MDIANNGTEAFRYFTSRNDYELVITDLEMPVMDGFECAFAIRKFEVQENRKRIPIIALTAYALQGYRERCFGTWDG